MLTDSKLHRSLVTRKACILDTSQSLNHQPASETQQNFSNLLTIGLKVPRLLEDADSVIAGPAERRASETMYRLLDIISQLEAFQIDWYQQYEGGCPYQIVPISEFGEFFTKMGENRTLFIAFDFQGRRDAHIFSTLQLLLLAARQAVLDLLDSGLDLESREELLRDLPKSTQICVDQLCCTIPYQSSTDQGFCGVISTLPMLQAAAEYFQLHGMDKKYTWCQRVVSQVHIRGVRSASRHFGRNGATLKAN